MTKHFSNHLITSSKHSACLRTRFCAEFWQELRVAAAGRFFSTEYHAVARGRARPDRDAHRALLGFDPRRLLLVA